MTDTPDNYEVGYKKPPKAGQFPKGKSGNPKGRPKKSLHETYMDMMHKSASVMTASGETLEMSKMEALFESTYQKAMKGDLKAAQFLLLTYAKSLSHIDPLL